jgi:hypothetical protein
VPAKHFWLLPVEDFFHQEESIGSQSRSQQSHWLGSPQNENHEGANAGGPFIQKSSMKDAFGPRVGKG